MKKCFFCVTYLLLICNLFFIVSCVDSDMECESIQPIRTIENFNDTVMLSSQVSGLAFVNGKYYLSDYHKGILSFDREFNSLSIENVDTGAIYLPQCFMFTVDGNGIKSVYNSKKKSFFYQKDGKWKCTDRLEYSVPRPSRYVSEGNTINFPIIKNKMTAAVLCDSTVVDSFAPAIKDLDDARMPYHSARMIVKNKDNLFVIGKGLPVVQMYSKDYKFLSTLDLRTIDDIANTFEQEKSEDPNSYFVIISDAYASNEYLYLLVSSKKKGKFKSNVILTLRVSNGTVELSTAYKLKGNRYSTICVNDKGQLVVVNQKTAGIEVYELDE